MGLLDILRSVAKDAGEEVNVHDSSVDVSGKGYVFRYGTTDAAVTRAILDSRETVERKRRREDKDK